MSERTLTEELQSVLRAHSLDAPEPTNSIAAILDQTVQSDRAVAGPTRWAAAARARLRAVPSSAVAAAAVVAAIVVLAVGVRSLGSSDSAPKSSSAGVSVAAGSASAGVDGPENAGPPSPVYGGEKSAAAGSARGGVFAPGLATVLCAKGETGVSTLVGTLPPPATGTASAASATPAQPLSVVQLDCMAADGKTLGSDLSVYRTGTGTTTRVAQLIRPAQGLAIGAVSVALPTNRLVVLAVQNGATVQYTYSISADRQSFVLLGTEQLTAPCRTANVAVNVIATASSAQDRRAGLVRVLNTGPAACNVSGYPSVLAQTAAGPSSGAVRYTLHGVLGGVNSSAFSTIRLMPGEAATALVEAGRTAGCAVSTALQVRIAAGQPSQSVPFAISTCALNVHPYVSGATGNG